MITGMKGEELQQVHTWTRLLGGEVRDKFEEHVVTHVVCDVDAEGLAIRTLKYCCGLLGGARMVTPAWVKRCMKERGWREPRKGDELVKGARRRQGLGAAACAGEAAGAEVLAGGRVRQQPFAAGLAAALEAGGGGGAQRGAADGRGEGEDDCDLRERREGRCARALEGNGGGGGCGGAFRVRDGQHQSVLATTDGDVPQHNMDGSLGEQGGRVQLAVKALGAHETD
eukprot:3598290-Rhodomonas_salina.1